MGWDPSVEFHLRPGGGITKALLNDLLELKTVKIVQQDWDRFVQEKLAAKLPAPIDGIKSLAPLCSLKFCRTNLNKAETEHDIKGDIKAFAPETCE